MKAFFIVFAFLLTGYYALAQDFVAEDFTYSFIKTPAGGRVVYNGVQHSFYFDIKSDSLSQGKSNDYLVAGKMVVQPTLLPFPKKLNFDSLSDTQQKENMLDFAAQEKHYSKSVLSADTLIEQQKFTMINGRLFLEWSYDMPASFKSISKECYLITICFDHMLCLNTPVKEGQTYDQIMAFLESIGRTLTLVNTPLDLNKMSNQMNK